MTASLANFLRHQFPTVSPPLRALFESAAENANLLCSDFWTIRDLLELSGYEGDEPLQVLLLCLLLALDEGSLCVEASEAGLARRLAWLVDDVAAENFARQAASALRQHGYPTLIGREVDDGKPVVLRTIGRRWFLYFQKYLKHELLLDVQLRQRLAANDAGANLPHLRTMLADVLRVHPILRGGSPVRLNDDQQRAVALALLRNFVVISGGPGTGKTSIVFTLLRCLARRGVAVERIALAAPTGRAAQRLSDALRAGLDQVPSAQTAESPDAPLRELTAVTLHHLLGYNPSRGIYRHHVENPVPADVVIVDEVSMVGLVLMAQLLQAVSPTAKLILLGDKDQLPSVEAGAVLASLAPADGQASYSAEVRAAFAQVLPESPPPPGAATGLLRDALVILEQNYRSQRDILAAAALVNRQDVDAVEALRLERALAPAEPFPPAAPGCWFLNLDELGSAQWPRALQQWLDQHYLTAGPHGDSYRGLVEACVLPAGGDSPVALQPLLDRLFAVLGQARILTLVREGPHGCAGINQFLEKLLRPRLDRRLTADLFVGAPVLITRNDPARGLFNGDVGIVLRDASGTRRVVFPRLGGYVSFAAELLPAHELAFALTVHKSQGSEYGRVLLVLPKEGGRRLLSKEMLYTGITRAKEQALIAATPASLQLAVHRRVERESALLGG
ncbi:MAG: exodeoxyribonuclease V subunit alpha [Planctomycetia bacterium]|nr:exodeoxyribonuclease V subunit alpha [Planctomycetia bacterium]